MTTETAVLSKSSLYFERYGFIQRQNVAFGLTIYLLGALCLVLVIGILVISMRPKAIYYIPAASSAGIAYPEKVPLSSVLNFAQAWLMDWVNYTPETVAAVYERSSRLLAPEFLAKVRSGMDAELKKIAHAQVSSVFSLKVAPEVKEEQGGFEAVFSGVRVAFAGKEELSREKTVFHVHVRRASVTTHNPYGLVIDDFQKDRMPSAHE